MEDLWFHQRESTKDKAEAAADALSLAIAKVQFVQVYLQNPTLPLPSEDQAKEPDDGVKVMEEVSGAELGSPIRRAEGHSSPTRKPVTKELRRKDKSSNQVSASQTPVGSPAKTQESLPTPVNSIPSIDISKDGNVPARSSRVRPAIAQSSFSWILGEDQRKSDFIAASPFSPERDRARGKAGYLFGDGTPDDLKPYAATSKGRNAIEHEKEESITLGTMKAAKEEGI